MAVNIIAGIECAIGAIEIMRRHNIGKAWSHDIAISAKIRISLVEIRHDGIGPDIVFINIVDPIGRGTIVRPAMTKAERMADFMYVGLKRIAVYRGAVTREPIGADIDTHGCNEPAAPAARSKGARLIIVEWNIAASFDFLKH